jgi:hypothetical protein
LLLEIAPARLCRGRFYHCPEAFHLILDPALKSRLKLGASLQIVRLEVNPPVDLRTLANWRISNVPLW